MALEDIYLTEKYEQEWWQVQSVIGNKTEVLIRSNWWEREIAIAGGLKLVSFRPIKYPETVQLFRSSDGEVFENLEGFRYLLRSYNHSVSDLAQFGGKPAISSQEEEAIYRWPSVIDSAWTRRRVGIINYGELFPEQQKIDWSKLEPFKKDGKVFIKTMRKPKVGGESYLIVEFGEDPRLMRKWGGTSAKKSIDCFIISEPLELEPEGRIPLEYRAWVANGRIAGITANELVYPTTDIPQSVSSFADNFVQAHVDILPWGYVIDIAIAQDEPVLVEVNTISNSARFSGHDFSLILEAFSKKFDRSKAQAAMPRIKAWDRSNQERKDANYD